MIEFAIGAALLMLIIFGSVQFGRSLMMRNEYSTADMDVEVTEIAGTSYMRIAVSLPFAMAMPFMPPHGRPRGAAAAGRGGSMPPRTAPPARGQKAAAVVRMPPAAMAMP